jgi:phosphatidylcholine synthase
MSSNLVFAWLVHLYTALGAVLAFLAILFIENGNFQAAFWLMVLAVLIDASDGTLARSARVKERLPYFDGDRLEDIVDYFNYVIVPSFFLLKAELLPADDALWLAMLPLLASAYGFCQKAAKTADHFFLGFPSYWNILVFYLYVLETPRWLNGFLVLILSLLVFVPLKYVYPSRTPILRGLTLSLGTLWGGAIIAIIHLLPDAPRSIAYVSLLYPIYYTALSFWLALFPKGAND